MTDAEVHQALVDLWCAATPFEPSEARWIEWRFVEQPAWWPLSFPERERACGLLVKYASRSPELLP